MYREHHGSKDPTASNPNHAEYEDYRLALKLSAELNSEPKPAQNDTDAEYALALQLELDNEMQMAEDMGSKFETESSPWTESNAWGSLTSPSEDQPVWESCDSDAAKYYPEAPSKSIPRGFTEFLIYLTSLKCTCGEQRFRSELDVTDMFQNWWDGKGQLSSWIKCRNCSASSCLGCVPEPFAKQSTLSAQNKRISWCCTGGRMLLIWILLCGFDEHFCAARRKEVPKPKRTSSSFGGKAKKKLRDSGIGYGTSPYGNEYQDFEPLFLEPSPVFQGAGSTAQERPRQRESAKSKVQIAEQVEDNFNTALVELLKGLLPSLDRESDFDADPPEAVADLFLHSRFLGYLAELVRNSLENATKRHRLYNALLGFLQAISMHTLANKTLFSERLVQPDAVNLLVLTFSRNTAESKEKESASSLASGFRNLSTQSELILQSAKANEKDFHTEEGQKMLLLCQQISELSQYLLAYTGAAPENKAQISADLVICDVPDDQILDTHAYASNAKSLQFSPPGRFKRLITEITTLKTGLPPGIFVRYCENRPDVLKVAIVGPMGTPYENGVFEFDFFCDAKYPNKPPLVLFKGTGGGRVSINPNLYHDGKVCLSLLGTWQGEPWKPGESTLLQVVLSLQAMIFCEEPWYNEPGRESAFNSSSKNKASVAYNQNVQQSTVQYAILPWLEQPPSLWRGVVDYHFKTNADNILRTIENWTQTILSKARSRQNYEVPDSGFDLMTSTAAHTPFGTPKASMASMLPQLQNALTKFGATYTIKKPPLTINPQPVALATPMPPAHLPYPGLTMPAIAPSLGFTGPNEPPPPYSGFLQTQPLLPNSSGQGRGNFRSIGSTLGSGQNQAVVNTTSATPYNEMRALLGELSRGQRTVEAQDGSTSQIYATTSSSVSGNQFSSLNSLESQMQPESPATGDGRSDSSRRGGRAQKFRYRGRGGRS